MPNNARRWVARIILATAGLFIGVLLIELGARLLPANAAAEMLFNAPQNTPPGMYSNDHKTVFRPTPGFEGTMRSLGYKVPIRVNSLGLRGPEPVDNDQPRWLAMGDSFTFAAQVAERQSFVGLLAASQQVQLFNSGSDGYGTRHELARFRQLEAGLAPELVVLVFFTGNDFSDNLQWREALRRATKRPNGLAIMGGPQPLVTSFLNKNSVVYGMFKMRKRAKAMAEGRSPEVQRWRREMSIFHKSGERELRAGIDATRMPMEELRDRVERQGGKFMVAVASPAFAVEDHRTQATFKLVNLDLEQADLSAPEKATLRLLEELEIPSCSLDTPLRAAYAEGERLYLPYDGHWSAAGHAVVAQTLDACLAEQGLSNQLALGQ